ncbi:MAG: hypothetical protein HY078_05285 [Elusimicrobia bacterium]|nr:hypothetical protein [Elusimicrobiota bacterium]
MNIFSRQSAETQGPPTIPDLKQDDKERRRGGVPLPLWGSPAEVGPLGLIGRLFAANSGLGFGLAAFSVVAVAAGLGWLNLSSAVEKPEFAGPPLRDAIAPKSSIVVKRPNNQYLDGLSTVNRGEISFETAAPPVTEAKADETAPPPIPSDSAPVDGSAATTNDALIRDQFVKKMTRNTRELYTGTTAGSQLAQGLRGNAPKFNQSLGTSLPSLQVPGRLTAVRTSQKRAASLLTVKSGLANRAMGQLKLARKMSVSGSASSGAESSRTYAADAFDQSKTIGGAMAGIQGGETVVPPGDGLNTPPTPIAKNVTPYQTDIDRAKADGDQAAQMQNTGTMMLIIGGLLLAAGLAMMMNPATSMIGGIMMAAGAALLALGLLMMMQAKQKADDGKQAASKVAAQSGQKEQASAVSNCMDQASGGVSTQNCRPPSVQVQRGTVQQDAETERNQSFTFTGGRTSASSSGN